MFDVGEFRIDVLASAVNLANNPGLGETDSAYYYPIGSQMEDFPIDGLDHEHEHIHIAAGCHIADFYFELSTLSIREMQEMLRMIDAAKIQSQTAKSYPPRSYPPSVSTPSTKRLREESISGDVTVSASIACAVSIEKMHLGLRTLPCEESS